MAAISGAAAIMLGAVPAYALSSVNVTAGAAVGNTPLTVTATMPTSSSLALTTPYTTITCVPQSATNTIKLTGKAKTGTGQSATNLAQITNSTWPSPGCTAAGTAATVNHGAGAPLQGTTWSVGASATSSPMVSGNPQDGQVTQVTVTGVGLTVKAGSCTFSIAGSISGNIKNGTTSTLTLTGANLKVSAILTSGSCLLGQLHVNDPVGLKAGTTSMFNLSTTVTATGAIANPIRINALP